MSTGGPVVRLMPSGDECCFMSQCNPRVFPARNVVDGFFYSNRVKAIGDFDVNEHDLSADGKGSSSDIDRTMGHCNDNGCIARPSSNCAGLQLQRTRTDKHARGATPCCHRMPLAGTALAT